jgi:hypothetical protein
MLLGIIANPSTRALLERIFDLTSNRMVSIARQHVRARRFVASERDDVRRHLGWRWKDIERTVARVVVPPLAPDNLWAARHVEMTTT